MEGQQEVLVESPVEERAYTADLQHCQIADLVQHELGLFAGRDHPVLGVLVEEHLQFVSLGSSLGHLGAGQENASVLRILSDQIYAEWHCFFHFKSLKLSKFHSNSPLHTSRVSTTAYGFPSVPFIETSQISSAVR